MIQDIDKRLRNEFYDIKGEVDDEVFIFDKNNVLLAEENGIYSLPLIGQAKPSKTVYLFAIGKRKFFLGDSAASDISEKFKYMDIRQLRSKADPYLSFASSTAYHLFQWYRDSQFCGRCGKPLVHDHVERMMKSPDCGNLVFPKVAPAVIVGVTDGDRILFTKYAGRAYKRYALIAGFTEIGETAEETVAREVMEEVGLKVKNVRYYKSQPWGTDSNLLMGFFADLDGDDSVRLDSNELAEAEWIKREDVIVEDVISLTGEMMSVFKEGRER